MGKVKKKNNIPSENRRNVGSIIRKLHFHEIGQNFWRYFRMDILLYVLSETAFVVGQEFAVLGGLNFDYERAFNIEEGNRLIYLVSDGSRILMRTVLNEVLIFGMFLAAGLLGLQFLCLWLSYFREDRKLRRILSPLDQLAVRADELSRLSFSEDKYQLLEEAITSIQPEDTRSLSFGDSDLAGVETAMNNLLRRMQESYRQQARFVNDASHELRTPIAVIQGYANMLDRWGKEDPKILEESIAAIQHESNHMNHLVEQLLFLARGDSGRTELHLEDVSLNEMMQEIYEESFMIDEDHVYRYSPPDEEIILRADPGLIKQAVRILVDNAAKYTKPGDEILLSCGRASNGEIFMQIEDTGIGMEEADVKQMFERFYRSDSVRSYDGTGLGLSIAKWIVDKHKGHFEILSRSGLGTRIRILLA
ncbi:MAG: HAMP domain-containing histidine kinase [Blautia sp.]|nr:HAMP domain-containing histidine kinase [Blautia sp.]